MASREVRGSEAVAEVLREAPELDELSRARMERRLLETVRREHLTGSHVATEDDDAGADSIRSPLRSHRVRSRRRRAPTTLVGLGAVAATAVAAAAAVWLVVFDGAKDQVAGSSDAATYQSYRDGESADRGALAEGETVATSTRERVHVHAGDLRVDVTPTSEARFVHLGEERVRVDLVQGAVEVEFHPERRGEQTMTVHTDLARVEVVGTVFRVEVDDEGATVVRVREGTVRVVPHRDGAARLVQAGAATRVRPEPEPEARGVAAEPVAEEAAGGPAERPSHATSASAASSPAPGADRASPSEPEGESSEPDAIAEEAAVAEGAASTAAEAQPTREAEADAPSEPARPLDVDARFDLADVLERRGNVERARHVLYGIARAPIHRLDRARAWLRIADSWEREGEPVAASEAYRRAAEAGRGTLQGHNALYAHARLRERRLGDTDGARAMYREYLEIAPGGPHAALCRRALCRLGVEAHCP